MTETQHEPTADGEPPDPMHPGTHPGAEHEHGEADDADLREEEGFVAPGMPEHYEGSPGAALVRDTEEDIPEPNEPA